MAGNPDKKYEVIGEPELPYGPEVVSLLRDAIHAFKDSRFAEAEELYQRILELEPNAIEAYNNLASIYARQKNMMKLEPCIRQRWRLTPCSSFHAATWPCICSRRANWTKLRR